MGQVLTLKPSDLRCVCAGVVVHAQFIIELVKRLHVCFCNGPHLHTTPVLKYIMSDLPAAEPPTSSLFNDVLKYVSINFEAYPCEKCCMVQEA